MKRIEMNIIDKFHRLAGLYKDFSRVKNNNYYREKTITDCFSICGDAGYVKVKHYAYRWPYWNAYKVIFKLDDTKVKVTFSRDSAATVKIFSGMRMLVPELFNLSLKPLQNELIEMQRRNGCTLRKLQSLIGEDDEKTPTDPD